MKRKFAVQKISGVAVLLLCAVFVFALKGGVTPEERDASALLVVAPFGFYMIFGKKLIFKL